MAWFKVDDAFFTSHKVLSIPRDRRQEVIGAWLLVGTWSAHKMTDGLVPEYVLDDFGIKESSRVMLIEAGLWIEHDDEIEFHDWAEYQPTREQMTAKRDETHAKKVAAGKKGAEARWHSDSKAIAENSKAIAGDSPVPVPVPLITKVINNRATRIKEDWNLGDDLKAWTVSYAPGLNIITERDKFVDYWLSKAGKDAAKTDWERTWKNWVRSNTERNPKLMLQPVAVDANDWMIAQKIELS